MLSESGERAKQLRQMHHDQPDHTLQMHSGSETLKRVMWSDEVKNKVSGCDTHRYI